ncbi:MAG: thiamine pyrophosphate-binding protein [Chloroflexi bacterium]|nr:thiamine pyrophosphate-binding protein [Chloroflexota bacterium]
MAEVKKEEKKMLIDKLKPRSEDEAPAVIPREMMEQVDVHELAAEMLKEEGVEYTFCLTHASIWPTEVNTQKAGIPRVHVRHEQAGTFAADAWGRMTRRPGVAIVGPATCISNALSGVIQCAASQAPMVVIQSGASTLTYASPEKVYNGIAKSVEMVIDPTQYLPALKRAFRLSVTHPTGPCVVIYSWSPQVPRMIPRMAAQSWYTPGYWAPNPAETMANPKLIEKSLRWLLEAEKPAMIVGHALHQDDAQDELREFVHLLGIPCHARRIARGAISEHDPLNALGRARGAVMRGADRALVMGLRVASLENMGRPPFWGTSTRYIQAQACREHVNLVLPTEFELIGNIKIMLRQYIDCARDLGIKGPIEKWANWRQFVADTKKDYEKRTLERTEKMRGKTPLHPDLVGRLTAEFFHDEYQDDYIPIIDGFTASSFFTDWNKAINSGTVLDAAETVGIGHGMGMALAAGLATKREKPILVLLGDGGLGAGGMDIETASKWNLPIIFLHENNDQMVCGGWNLFLPNVASPTGNRMLDAWETLPKIRYDRMFAEFGCHPEFVERDDQIKPALKRACDFAMREKKPAFIEAFVDPEVLQEIWVGMTTNLARFAKWDELTEEGRNAILEYGLVPRSSMGAVDPTWRAAILANQQKKEG